MVESAVRSFLRGVEISAGEKVLVACSGGPDSTALLYALHGLRKEFGYSLVVACLDHGLRPEHQVANEIRMLETHCRGLWVDLEVDRVAAGTIVREASAQGVGIEAAARARRYRYLDLVADRSGCSYIATGHNQDDQLETLLQRFFQGAGPSGLAGIPARRGRIIRPLLEVPRREIERYLEERGLATVDDPSNLSQRHLRNTIRHTLIPTVRSLFPGYERALRSLAEKMSLCDELITSEAEHRIPFHFDRAGRTVMIRVQDFAVAPPAIRLQALYRAVDQASTHDRAAAVRLPYRAVRDVVFRSFTAGQEPGKVLLRSGSVEIRLERDYIAVSSAVVFGPEKSYLVSIHDALGQERTVETPRLGLCMSVGPESPISSRAVPVTGEPLLVRSRRDGDVVDRSGRAVSMKELLHQWAVPPERRWRVPVVQDRSGIVAVLGDAECGRRWVAGRSAGQSSDTAGAVHIDVSWKE